MFVLDFNKTNSIHNNVSGKKSVHLTPRGHPRYVPTSTTQTMNSIDNDITTEAETTVDFKYPPESDVELNFHRHEEKQQQQAETILYENNNQQQRQKQQLELQTDVKEQRQHIIDSHPLKHTFSNNIDNDEKIHHQQQHKQQQKQQQLLSKPYRMKQRKKKLQHNKTHTIDSCCTVIYKRAGGLMADVSGDCIAGQQQQQQHYQQLNECYIGDNHDVELMKHNIGLVIETPVGGCNDNEDLLESRTTSTFADELTR